MVTPFLHSSFPDSGFLCESTASFFGCIPLQVLSNTSPCPFACSGQTRPEEGTVSSIKNRILNFPADEVIDMSCASRSNKDVGLAGRQGSMALVNKNTRF